MEKRKILFGLLLVMFVVYLAGGEAIAAGKVKAVGMLTSIESDGSVVIDDKGYSVDPSARILDHEGKRVSLKNFSLPLRVDFAYEYTEKGPVIKLIREYPEEVPQ